MIDSDIDMVRNILSEKGAIIYVDSNPYRDNDETYIFQIESSERDKPYNIPQQYRPEKFKDACRWSLEYSENRNIGVMIQDPLYFEGEYYTNHKYMANINSIDDHVNKHGSDSLLMRMECTENGERHRIRMTSIDQHNTSKDMILYERDNTIGSISDLKELNINNAKECQNVFKNLKNRYKDIRAERGLDSGLMIGSKITIYDNKGYLLDENNNIIDIDESEKDNIVINQEMAEYMSYSNEHAYGEVKDYIEYHNHNVRLDIQESEKNVLKSFLNEKNNIKKENTLTRRDRGYDINI